MKLKEGQHYLVLIKWIDSISRIGPWHDVKDLPEIIEEMNSDYFYSIGYLIGQTKTLWFICKSIYFQDDEPAQFGGIFAIPKGCVLKMKKIKNGRREGL